MSNELDLHPDSPKSVIRTYSNYNRKGPKSGDSSPSTRKKSRWSSATPPGSPSTPTRGVKGLVPPSPGQVRKTGQMDTDLRMQALGNSFLQVTAAYSPQSERKVSRSRGTPEEFTLEPVERKR